MYNKMFYLTGRRHDAPIQTVHVHSNATRVHEPALVPLPHLQDGGRCRSVYGVR